MKGGGRTSNKSGWWFASLKSWDPVLQQIEILAIRIIDFFWTNRIPPNPGICRDLGWKRVDLTNGFGVSGETPRFRSGWLVFLDLPTATNRYGFQGGKIVWLGFQTPFFWELTEGERTKYWVVVSNIFYFHPYLGKISNLTNIFQMGWNHQLEIYLYGVFYMAINDTLL